MGSEAGALERFSEPTRSWFRDAFHAPTAVQGEAWSAIAGGSHALVIAPTGSGKTLAAFLWALDSLLNQPAPEPGERCRVLYVSPLKALAADVDRNLRVPLSGIAARGDGELTQVHVGIRTGDTPPGERRRFATKPPDILITTPESLYLLLTSAARSGLRGVRTVILDEVHALAGNKRGAHLALSLERLDAMLPEPAQRIGLSATVRPPETVARFLAGSRTLAEGGRDVRTVRAPALKAVDISVVVPVPDLGDISTAPRTGGRAQDPEKPASNSSIWPHVEARVTELIRSHRSTIVFANSRRGAERLTARINEYAPGSALAHHGSMSREERELVESGLKSGRLPAVVATSTLELGIDMGAVDLVIQVGAPPSVASALQRIGRAGHQVGATSYGVVFPTHRGDLLTSAVIAQRAANGDIEDLRMPANPLDVLAQQLVAMVAVEDWNHDELARVVRRAAPFADLSERALDGVLDMLCGRYPSEEFGQLRPRLVWDRERNELAARPGALRLAVISGGTIPDRGLYGVYLVGGPAGGRRVGELDEEMVYESRVGETFTLGTSTWRIAKITPDRVLVAPAPGSPGRLPFWHGDSPGRPAELGAALGRMVRELAADDEGAAAKLAAWGLDPWATDNLRSYLREQEAATGRLADDRTVVVERFRDELGDWRVVVHSPWGARVNAPWALAMASRLRARLGIDVQPMHSDDGIVLRLPDHEGTPDDPADEAHRATLAMPLFDEHLVLDPTEVAPAVVEALAGSAHFAARFREAAARALLLPRSRPNRRQPLWQQRQRSAQLLGVVSGHPDFPIAIEAVRECLQDDFDVPALTRLMAEIAGGSISVLEVTTPAPSPAARSLLFGYVGQFLYEGDSPLAERRAAALSLDPALLGELLGDGMPDVADLLDREALAQVELEVGLANDRARARDAEQLFDLVRRLGPVSEAELRSRAAVPHEVGSWLAELGNRVLRVEVAGREQLAVLEDAGRLRDALGVELPEGLPAAVVERVADPLGDLLRRHARTHGPFTADQAAGRFGLGVGPVAAGLADLHRRGVLACGRLRPDGAGGEYCDADVLRRIRRHSLRSLRAQVQAVGQRELAVFLPRWQGVGSPWATPDSGRGPALHGLDGLVRAVEQLAGARIPVSALETLVLPARVRDYEPAMLDELISAGEIAWVGAGQLPGDDGMLAVAPSDLARSLLRHHRQDGPQSATHVRILEALGAAGARFFRDLQADVGTPVTETVDALWDLVWAGLVTNDTLGPLRARTTRRATRRTAATARPRRGYVRGLRTAVPPRADAAGRWSLSATGVQEDSDVTALAATLLDRHGVLTRGAAADLPGGFQAAYAAMARLEEDGLVRRGYFVEGLGAAQFALPESVDRLRGTRSDEPGALVLAAMDPANPYGEALSWPERPGGRHPGRIAGALVALVDGELVLYVERGGRTITSFGSEPEPLAAAAAELAAAVRAGAVDRLEIQRIDGDAALESKLPAAAALRRAGFVATPRGLRLRA